MNDLKQKALNYHRCKPHGKTSMIATKPFATQEHLSLAYTPGVAAPCLAIQENPEDSYTYTNRGNLVAVVTNGTAVLGLGDIGAKAAKPVMEGKAVLFKRFAGVDAIDLEINETDPQKLVEIIKSLQPGFGGINLEDIKAPDCFYLEEELKKQTEIPVFHDDQHGTAIITTAGLINALEIVGKSAKDIKIVFSGAGAAGIACAKMCLNLGVTPEQIFMFDRKGLVTKDRDNLEPYRGQFAQKTNSLTLEKAFEGADVFIGVSSKDLVSPQMLKSMNKNPIVFAMANPDPEISYPAAKQARNDIIMATGRSDFPNQVNNVLGFPFIFRGALDTHARGINENMKMAAAKALAGLAKEDVLRSVEQIYGVGHLSYGPDYIIPKPFDPRVLIWVSLAVAKAATESGVARKPLQDAQAYKQSLTRLSHEIFSSMTQSARIKREKL